ncbi:hypothetical protein RCL1_003273 [Eukaryota sp. TZLM3-RCL]
MLQVNTLLTLMVPLVHVLPVLELRHYKENGRMIAWPSGVKPGGLMMPHHDSVFIERMIGLLDETVGSECSKSQEYYQQQSAVDPAIIEIEIQKPRKGEQDDFEAKRRHSY